MSCPHCQTEILKSYRVYYICENGHEYSEDIEPARDPAKKPTMTFGRRGHEKILDTPTAPEHLKMPFGKHKGMYIEDLETDYIRWCLENLERLDERIKTEMESQLTLRSGRGVKR